MRESITTRVARGAALLDETRPGWVDKVDLDRLDMSSVKDSVTAQVNGTQDVLSHDEEIVRHEISLGLTTYEDEEWDDLTLAWKVQINDRRSHAA
jgi:hypothetical protein